MTYFYRKLIFLSVTILLCASAHGQKVKPGYASIPDSLRKDANVIVRKYVTEIERTSLGRLTQKEFIAITVLNEKGNRDASMYLSYDKYIKVLNLRGRVYNNMGILVKDIKMKDFYDSSSYQDFVFFSDDRAKMFAPKMSVYPYTVEYEYEILVNGFVHIDSWFPSPGFHVAVESATLTFKTPASIDFKFKSDNYPFNYEVSRGNKDIVIHKWSMEGHKAIKKESLMPAVHAFMPYVLLSPVEFEYQGYKGDFTNWVTYGKWVNSLLAQRTELTEPTKTKIKELTADLTCEREKVKAVYRYVQGKTRYVAVMEGIGGLQPMLATDVDKFAYGDCKALSNYTRSLLSAIGIQSYYTTIGADNVSIRDVDFASKDQTNHVILTVPLQNDTVLLECTNPYAPFGYLGAANSNRKAVMITEMGGQLIDMPYFSAADNLFSQVMKVDINSRGDAVGALEVSASGLRFDGLGYKRVSPEREQRDFLLKSLPINNLEINSFNFRNEGETSPVAYLNVDFKAGRYGNVSGNMMFIPLNKLDKSQVFFSNTSDRSTDVFFPYGVTNEANIEFSLPSDYEISFIPKSEVLESPYGYYTFTCEVAGSKIKYHRKLIVYSGTIKKEEYAQVYDFFDKVGQFDNANIVLKKL